MPKGGKIASETEIIKALFRAAMGVDPDQPGADPGWLWLDFLNILAQSAQATSALLQFFTQGREVERWHSGQQLSNGPPEPQLMRQGRVYSQIDLPGNAGRDQPLRALKWPMGEGFGLLTLERPERDFRAVDGLHLSNLLPYLGQAGLGWQALRLRHDRAALDQKLGQGLGAGWVVLGLAGNVLDLSRWLRDWLAGPRELRLRSGGWLEFSDPVLGQSFQQAVAGVVAADGAARLTQLSRSPRLEMILSRGRHGTERALIGAVRLQPIARGLAVDQVAAAYGLSRSEARLAMLLCDGFTLADAAQQLGWTLETARSCSKQLYARMGVNGQPGVVRRILNGPLWLGGALRADP